MFRTSQTAIEGRCPELLQNLLEVRGIGLLDIKAIFGETAVRRKMRLKLIVHLVRKETMEREFERLPYEPLYEDVLGVPVRKVVIAVDAGRNLAVLVEAAVRNTILQLRGIDTYQEFIERHQQSDGAQRRHLERRRRAVPALLRARCAQPSFVQRAYSASECSCSSKPRAMAMARWRCSISASKNSSTRPQSRHTRWSWCWPSLSSKTALPARSGCAQQPGLLELHQHAVDRGQPDVGAIGEQHLEHVLGGDVAARGRWKTSRILMRGSVALRPVLLSSSAWVMVTVPPGRVDAR